MNLLMFALVFVLGGFLVVQAPMNGGLTKNLTHFVYSTVSIIFLIGAAFMLIIAIATGAQMPVWAEQTTVWWHWMGGVLGAAYVTITTIVTPKVGSTITMVMVLLGRVLFATGIDQFGLAGCAVHETTLPRLGGIALVLVGAVLVGLAKSPEA